MRNITKREKDEERFHTVVEAAPSAMIMVNREGKITFVNKRVELLFGYGREELLGQFIEILVPERYRSKHLEYRNRFFESPSPRFMGAGRDLFGLRKDGTEVPIEIGLNPIETPEGLYILTSIIDITERKMAEETFKKAHEELQQLSRMKSEFTSMVSHDLKTPLAVLRECIELILDQIEGPITERQKETLHLAKSNVDRMVRLINNVLDLERLEAGKMELALEKTNLNELLTEVYKFMKLVAQKRKIHLSLELPAKPLSTLCDPDKFEEVVINLIDNGLKYTREGGRINIQMKQEEKGIEIIVADNGMGIKKEDQKKIFEMFTRSSENRPMGGMSFGVGLTVCKHLIDLHQGQISVKSKPGQGTAFKVRIPQRLN